MKWCGLRIQFINTPPSSSSIALCWRIFYLFCCCYGSMELHKFTTIKCQKTMRYTQQQQQQQHWEQQHTYPGLNGTQNRENNKSLSLVSRNIRNIQSEFRYSFPYNCAQVRRRLFIFDFHSIVSVGYIFFWHGISHHAVNGYTTSF